MRFAIVDDLAFCRDEIKKKLFRYIGENFAGEHPQIDEFDSGELFLENFSPETYDMIFIDQYMNGISGIDTAKKIRESDNLVALVFITTSRDHALDSYEVRASGYLVKPYKFKDFSRTMELVNMIKLRNARFISIGGRKILLREILWCDRDEHYVQIHTDRQGILRLRLSFAELEQLLLPYVQFLSCYRGCMVNMDRAVKIHNLNFIMDTGEAVPFRKRDRGNIEKQFNSYLFQREREEWLF